MAITSVAAYLQWANITTTDADRDASLNAIIAEATDEVQRFCRPHVFGLATQTDRVLDAPWNSEFLTLPLGPVRAVTSLYVRHDAKGDPSLFTSDYLKVAFQDYRLVIDMDPEGWAKQRRVQILNASFWGNTTFRPCGRLGFGVKNVPGAIKVTYSHGYSPIPPKVSRAVHLMTSMMYARRKTGLPVASASLNGASYSTAGAFSATAALHSPDVLSALYGFYDPMLAGGS